MRGTGGRSKQFEGGVLGVVEGVKSVGERLADSLGRAIEGGDAIEGGGRAVAFAQGAAVEREAQGAAVPVVGGRDKASLGEA